MMGLSITNERIYGRDIQRPKVTFLENRDDLFPCPSDFVAFIDNCQEMGVKWPAAIEMKRAGFDLELLYGWWQIQVDV